MKLKLKNLHTACPTQWEGTSENNDEVYIKYRYGDLRLDINNQTILNMTVGDEWDGVMKNEQLAKYLKDYKIEFLNGDMPKEEYDIEATIEWLESINK